MSTVLDNEICLNQICRIYISGKELFSRGGGGGGGRGGGNLGVILVRVSEPEF